MATTTNYSWTTPDDTALVKDGAAAIRSLGTAIDSTVFTNAGNAIAKTIVDAKGDIIAATAADTVSRLGVGTNGQYLAANSSTATGLEWQTVSAGGITLLSTTTLSGTVTTVSSIDQTYRNLIFIVQGATYSTGGTTIWIQPNGSGTTSWMSSSQDYQGTASVVGAGSYMATPQNMKRTGGENVLVGTVFNYANTSYWKSVQFVGGGMTVDSIASCNGGGMLRTTSAVTSVSVTTSDAVTFSGGQLLILGVK